MQNIVFISCCLNEADNIPELYSEINEVMEEYSNKLNWNLLLIDDGSNDDTDQIVTKMIENKSNMHYLKLNRNFGKEAAITAGIDHCGNCDAAILIDADLQHPTDSIRDLIDAWRKGFDMVVAIPKRRAYSLTNKIFSFIFHRAMSYSSDDALIIDGGDFRLISKRLIEYLRTLQEKNRYMKGIYGLPGGKVAKVFYEELARMRGNSEFSFKKRCSLALNGIISMTTSPIRFFTLFGFSILAAAFLYLIYILFGIIVNGKDVPGFASLLFSSVILNGLIMIQIGVQGEYIAQILKETKNRPIYFVEKEIKMNKNQKTHHLFKE